METDKHGGVILAVDALVQVAGHRTPLVVLVQRGKEPFKGKLVMPGGHVELNETAEDACRRELKEEIGFKRCFHPEIVAVLSKPGRDPRSGRRVSLVYHVWVNESELRDLKAGSDADAIVVCDPRYLSDSVVGFDHGQIIHCCLK